ncbi:homoprotocatechuate degradation operon regulator HpaR [Halomonas piscis]|uniref:Homoprotocatechuate degradation operon regulator HpaR n=1 Tax=Halomonas piscis TaxID=3031727 RepID=A0ABY9Z392_9GAMM|nr:homoprotocatechuate degradation operon regulator HpaR [Halomonas piscis]WNK21617.1 homoprotocatechuate degradation operon regulator HpaR [Halomonas piscis]
MEANQIEKLSEATERPQPPATRRALPMALLQARESVMSRFRPVLHEHGITEQQWRVMRVLSENDVLTAMAISEQANIFASSLSRILKTLEKHGLVVRLKSVDDARLTLIRLTEEGHDIIDQIAPESLSIYAKLEEELGGGERIELLISMLNELTELHHK